MKLKLFKCDGFGCKKKICVNEILNEGYPYKDGWMYIYKFEMKISNDKFIKEKDLHFCSSECIEKYLSYLILMEEKNVKKI